MDFQTLRTYCLNKKGAIECFPFDEETLVFKVGSKMFGITNEQTAPISISLKCEPFMAGDLRREYSAITPGYHLNKQHWNTITIDGTISDEKIFWLIDLSYELVYKGLKKSEKLAIQVRCS